MVKCAFQTVATLFGGLLVGLIVGDIVFRLIPGSSVENVKIGHALIAAVPALAGFMAGGTAWGVQMGRLAGVPGVRRMALAGMVGFAPITIMLAAGLGLAEPVIVGSLAEVAPIHRVFTLLFVPSAFLIAGVSAYAIGREIGGNGLARSLLWRVGVVAGVTFLLINLLMESLGWVVGAPAAAERATMITVLAVSNLGAALAGGAALGRFIYSRHGRSVTKFT
jgi:hypothetical protein